MDAWIELGGVSSGVDAASWGTFETEIFAIRDDGELANRYWDGTSWHAWDAMGGPFVGTPAASAKHADRIDVFAVATNGEVRRRWWDGREWVPWRPLDGGPTDALDVACTWIGDRLDVFVRTASGALWYAALAEGAEPPAR